MEIELDLSWQHCTLSLNITRTLVVVVIIGLLWLRLADTLDVDAKFLLGRCADSLGEAAVHCSQNAARCGDRTWGIF